MQEIADEAGINKALLHYYFRSKDKLFQKIFESTLDEIAKNVKGAIKSDSSIFEKLECFIEAYTKAIMANSYLPMFVLNEMNQNPERLQKILMEKELVGEFIELQTQFAKEVNKGKIRSIHPSHLMLNIMGLVVFPFAVRPMVEPMLKKHIGINYEELLAERKGVVFDFIYNALKITENEG